MFAAVAWPPARDTDQVAGGVVAEQNSARREVTALEGPSVCLSARPPSAALPVVLRRPGRPEIAVRQSLSFRRDDQASPPLKLSFFRHSWARHCLRFRHPPRYPIHISSLHHKQDSDTTKKIDHVHE